MWKSQPCPGAWSWVRSSAPWRVESETFVQSAEPEAGQQARLSDAYEDAVGARGAVAATQEGPQATHGPDSVEAPGRLTAEQLPRSYRITRATDLRALMSQGKRRRTDHLDLFTRPSPVGHSRLAIVVPRHTHSAVHRNQLRRRLREIARRLVLPVLPAPTDVGVRARATAYEASYGTLRQEMVGALCPS